MDLAVKRPSAYALAKVSDRGYECLDIAKIDNNYLIKKLTHADLIVMDAPLHPPYKGFREVEREALRTYKARLLPGGTPGIEALSALGYSLFASLAEAGKVVIETHPGSVKRRLQLYPRQADPDLVDAVVALSVGICLLEAKAVIIEGTDGVITFAKRECRSRVVKIIEECLLLLKAPELPNYHLEACADTVQDLGV